MEETWIRWFCSMDGHEFFCEVDRVYIGAFRCFARVPNRTHPLPPPPPHTTTPRHPTLTRHPSLPRPRAESRFNLYGLPKECQNFQDCLGIILDYVSSDSSSEDWERATEDWLRRDCVELYGRIHARFINTARGQQLMHHKFRARHFGRCPRVYCEGQAVLPCGLSDTPGERSVMVYCPRCRDVYQPNPIVHRRNIDGSYFGTTFPHFFLLIDPDLVPTKSQKKYLPRIFGYKVLANAPIEGAEADAAAAAAGGVAAIADAKGGGEAGAAAAGGGGGDGDGGGAAEEGASAVMAVDGAADAAAAAQPVAAT